MKKLAMIAAAVLIGGTASAHAGTVVSGFNSSSLAANDDNYAGPASLGFTVNFFGQTYSDTYVSNNGYFTFGAGQSTYTPTGLTAAYSGNPIIAAFYADVDTRAIGTLTYGTGTYAGMTAFGATWTDVGYYDEKSDKTNTFQEIIVDRSDIAVGDFDIYFNYDMITWETGDVSGGTDGLGGTSAAVGYANGSGASGTYDQLLGSLTPGSFLDGGPYSLVAGTNDGTPGQYLFQVRNGTVVTPTTVPEPGAIALLGIGFLGQSLIRRRRRHS